MEQQKKDLRINNEIIKMLDDVKNIEKLEQLARLEILRKNEREDFER